MESLYQYAKFQFDCGVYTGAFDALGYYISLSTNAENKFSALWGRLASAILLERWSEAKNDLEALREEIEIKVKIFNLKKNNNNFLFLATIRLFLLQSNNCNTELG